MILREDAWQQFIALVKVRVDDLPGEIAAMTRSEDRENAILSFAQIAFNAGFEWGKSVGALEEVSR